MKPNVKIYYIKVPGKDNSAFDTVAIKTSDGEYIRPCCFDDEEGVIRFQWMKKDRLVAWLRLVADLIEKETFE